MIRFVTQWFGLDTLGEDELNALREPVARAIMRATLYYEGRVKKKLTGARTGRIYIIGGITHQASAPGEPPASFTGKLRQSITHTDVMWDGDNAFAEVGSSEPQARILEFGGITSHGVRILPRPYFSATWLEEEAKIQSILDKAVSTKAVLGDIVPEVVE